MGHQTWVYLIQSDVFQAHQVTTGWDRENYCEITLSEPLPILEWIQCELAAANNADEEEASYIRGDIIEYVLEHEPGMHMLTTFEKSWRLSDDMDAIKPHLPEHFHDRVDHLFGMKGTAVASGADIPLAILDQCDSIWTFFTREEMIEIGPLVREALKDQQSDSLDYEWKAILTAHDSHQYDLVAFVFPFM